MAAISGKPGTVLSAADRGGDLETFGASTQDSVNRARGFGERPTLADRFSDFRNQLIRRPGFIRWASRLWLTRPLARKRTRDLFDLAAGFVYTKILTAVVDLKVCERLANETKSSADLSQETGLAEEALGTVLKGAEALGLIRQRRDGRWALDELGAALLANPGVMAMVEHHKVLYRDLEDPLALLRTPTESTELSRYWCYVGDGTTDDQSVSDYSALMAASQDFICQMVVDAYPFHRHKRLLDVGGGEGRFARAVVEENPTMEAQIFDLPPVARRANEVIHQGPHAERLSALGGDFFTDSLPSTPDLISLVRIVHDHDDDKVLKLLANIRSSVESGATLLIAEPLAKTPGAEKAGAAYFGFYLMAMRSGRPRTAEEIASLLEATGFSAPVEHATAIPLLARVLTARAK